jgi:long-chain acyl-CoA synthetase
MNPPATTYTPAEQPVWASPASGPEGPQTLGQMVLDVAAKHRGIALQYTRNGSPAYISYPQLGTIATEIARGLIALGVDAGDRVAILGLTSAPWTLADCGAQCAGTVVVPIYHTNSPDECAYVLAHSDAKVVFCEDAAQAAKVEQVRDRCPELEHIVLFEDGREDVLTIDRLRRLGSEVPPEAATERLAALSPDDLATLVYTSGTTGPPKGCMLSHANFLSTTRMYAEQLHFNDTHSLYQFLPLAHVLARVAQAVALSVGARIIYWTGDPAKIVDELSETTPTHFPAVPRIYEKIHGVVLGRVADGPRIDSCSPRCGARSGRHWSSRWSAQHPWRASCWSSSTRAACSFSRATA